MPKSQKRDKRARPMPALRWKDVDEIFPPRLCVTLRYQDILLLTAASNFTGNTYRMNSLFDPDQTGTGSQPNFYDQFSALYQKYRVIRCRYKITMTSRVGTGGVAAICFTNATTHGTVGSVQNCMGNPESKSCSFGAAGAPPGVIQGVVDIGRIYGVPDDVVMADPSFLALVSASVGNSVYGALCIETAGATDTVEASVLLEFDAVFELRQYLAQS